MRRTSWPVWQLTGCYFRFRYWIMRVVLRSGHVLCNLLPCMRRYNALPWYARGALSPDEMEGVEPWEGWIFHFVIWINELVAMRED